MYSFKTDLDIILKTLNISLSELGKELGFDLPTLSNWLNGKYEPDDRSKEDIYAHAYSNNVRINKAYEEPLKELANKQKYVMLFHGSKEGIEGEININKSRNNNDFGKGFYMGESLIQSAIFVSEYSKSHIYSYGLYLNKLKVKEYKVDIKWMLTIAYYRGRLNEYKDSKKLKKIIEESKNVDVIIAPIADNRMFDIIDEFVEGRITNVACEYALASLDLGRQFILKTDKAINNLGFIKEYYLCKQERKEYIDYRNTISKERLKTIKDFRSTNTQGKYIEEIL